MATDDRADVPDQHPQDHGDEEAEDEGHRRVEEEELDLHGLRVLRDEDQDQQDEDAEPPGPPVGLLLLRLRVPSVGHGATLSRRLRHSTAWIAAWMSPKLGTVSVRRPPGPSTCSSCDRGSTAGCRRRRRPWRSPSGTAR